MTSDFAENLTLLRKERKISQKQAAADLGVSQALLSHYEKGVRECGLKFLVKAADYYNVSCDVLLGRGCADEADSSDELKAADYRRTISGAVNSLMSFSGQLGSRAEKSVVSCLMLSLYKLMHMAGMFRKANPAADETVNALAAAAVSLSEAEIVSAAGISGSSPKKSTPDSFAAQCEKLITDITGIRTE